MIHLIVPHLWLTLFAFLIPIIGQSAIPSFSGADITQLLSLILTTMAGVLPGSTQNQETQQQQASQRQLSASDLAGNPQNLQCADRKPARTSQQSGYSRRRLWRHFWDVAEAPYDIHSTNRVRA